MTRVKKNAVVELQPLTVDEWLGRMHVNGVYATQEVFEADLLNRVLVEVGRHKTRDRVESFMHYLQEDLREVDIVPDEPTRTAFAACVEAANPVVGLSLLRLARTERVMAKVITELWPELGEQVETVLHEYTAPDFTIALHINGVAVKGSGRRIFKLSGKALLAEGPDMQWYFSEFLNVPYAVKGGLLGAGRLIYAKCHALKALVRTVSHHDAAKQQPSVLHAVWSDQKAARYEYLRRQAQFACMELAGFVDAQQGMPADEAWQFLGHGIAMRRRA